MLARRGALAHLIWPYAQHESALMLEVIVSTAVRDFDPAARFRSTTNISSSSIWTSRANQSPVRNCGRRPAFKPAGYVDFLMTVGTTTSV